MDDDTPLPGTSPARGDGASTAPLTEPAPTRSTGTGVVVALILVGSAVSLSLGIYGRVHSPTYSAITTLGFPSLMSMKAWLASGAAALGLVQVLTALRMYGRIGTGPAPRAVARLHRASGVTAVLLTLPVALQCLWSLGFATYSTRVLLHSLAGCAFYGVLVTKMLGLHVRRFPGWAVPWLGGALFTILVVAWLTSALWYFASGSPGYV